MSYTRTVATLTAAFALLWLVLALHPISRQDWLLENILVALFVPLGFIAFRHQVFSRFSWTLLVAFMALHQVGAHYTYSQVPYDEWWRWLTGNSFNEWFGWDRNHFDRLVHFLYGLMLAYPMRELLLRVAKVRGFWGYFLPLDLTMSSSLLYELIEWLAASVLGGDLGQAYLGTQGDPWDAHKDMALAALGALISMVLAAGFNFRLQRDFAREWSDSWKVSDPDNSSA